MFSHRLSHLRTLRGLAGGGAAVFLPRVARSEDLKSLDPPFRSSPSDTDVIDAIYSRLTAYRPGDQWHWNLDAAEMIEQVDDTRIAFRLRPGIRYRLGEFESV